MAERGSTPPHWLEAAIGHGDFSVARHDPVGLRYQLHGKLLGLDAHDLSARPLASPEQTAASDFERSLAELEGIVAKLEQGDLSLDESLRHFERGVQLTRVCQSALKQAEQKVEILLRKSGASEQFEAAPFDAEDHERDS
jgi:exodeoxyribonuclease VII small subunit